jgi:hypothetical protein
MEEEIGFKVVELLFSNGLVRRFKIDKGDRKDIPRNGAIIELPDREISYRDSAIRIKKENSVLSALNYLDLNGIAHKIDFYEDPSDNYCVGLIKQLINGNQLKDGQRLYTPVHQDYLKETLKVIHDEGYVGLKISASDIIIREEDGMPVIVSGLDSVRSKKDLGSIHGFNKQKSIDYLELSKLFSK